MATILILHGWGRGSISWLKVKEILENQGLRVLVPDLPGFGRNPLPRNPWSIDNYVEWVKDFAEKNNLAQLSGEPTEPFFLLGHSFGGRIAMKFAVKYPEKLAGLILVSAAGITKRKSLKNFIFFILAKLGKLFFRQRLFKRIIYKLAGSRDYMLAGGIMQETMKKTISEDLKPYLSKISAKTLVIWGKDDKETPIADAYLINKSISGSKLEILDGVGHGINFEAPEILVQKIKEFIGGR
jgi:pimeloyl-ACP methyl ester carboxylesterase